MKRWKTRIYVQLKDRNNVQFTGEEDVGFMTLFAQAFTIGTSYDWWKRNNQNGNYKNYSNVFEYSSGQWNLKEYFKKCWYQIATRHQEDIIFALDEEEYNDADMLYGCMRQFYLSIVFIAQQTADKYSKLLELYSSEKDKLMDALENITSESSIEESSEEATNEGESSRSGSNSASKSGSNVASKSGETSDSKSGSKSGNQHQETESNTEANESTKARTRFSDTPEMAGMYDDEKYTSNLTNGDVDGESESSGETTLDSTDSEQYSDESNATINEETSAESSEESSGSTSESASNSGSSNVNREASGEKQIVSKLNPMTIMARIKEIDDNYKNVMLAWVNEFDRLFIDGSNV